MMDTFLADLHIHTLLSPCGSLEMSPARIVQEALAKGLHIIGITDHNSTRQCRDVFRRGEEKGLTVLCGAEVATREEVHCMAFFENFEKLDAFQLYLDEHLPDVANVPEKFGDQVWVDEHEMIVGEEKRLLIAGLNQSIEDVEKKVHSLGGLFIAAHIDRTGFSILSQLGFIPPDLMLDGVEVVNFSTIDALRQQYALADGLPVITSSDAHVPEDIGRRFTQFRMKEPTFAEIGLALKGLEGRGIIYPNAK